MAEDAANPTPSKKRLWFLPWSLLFATIVGGLFLFFVITGLHIVRAAGETPTHKADLIAVFGAAEYAGRPSPVYRARLDHGYELYKSGMAPMVITTGGAAQDPNFSEGGVGKDYLLRRGILERKDLRFISAAIDVRFTRTMAGFATVPLWPLFRVQHCGVMR